MVSKMREAVFLDRDGVLIEDVNLLQEEKEIRILPGVPEALNRLKAAGFLLIVVSNQPIVARGILTEEDVDHLNGEMRKNLILAGAPPLDGVYYCPHHPNATLTAYRVDCDCRKPKPGLLIRAAEEMEISLCNSYMIGDRITDIIAGSTAGCRTILVETGQHTAPPIQTTEALDLSIEPDHVCRGLLEAAVWILESK